MMRGLFNLANSVISTRGWGDYAIALVSVACGLAVRAMLEQFGHFYYLPMVPPVMVTAYVTGRRAPTLLAIALSLIANFVQVEREDFLDMTVNAGLFIFVCWLIVEMCWRLRDMRSRAADLSQRLTRRNQMLDAILASAPMVTLDREGRIRFLTPRACAVLGVSEEQAVGSLFSALVSGFEIDCVEGATRGDGEAEAVWTGRRPNGQTYPLSIQFGVMPNDSDGDYATLCLTDLTQAHAADARAQDLGAQLNRVWRLNSLGEMAASMAHELNQPLSAATNYLHASQVAAEKAGLMGESVSRTMGLAKAQILRAGAIIRRMRELLAHETRAMGVERIAPMMADMHGILGMIERNGGVKFELRIDDLNDHVRVERIQFQQAMINLIRNAVDALQEQADRRVLVVGRVLTSDHYELRVEDNGRGIAPEQLETIFRPLMTTKSGGMGLGLSVTRTIVESHGGTLRVDRSELGGAAFSFCLMRERDFEAA